MVATNLMVSNTLAVDKGRGSNLNDISSFAESPLVSNFERMWRLPETEMASRCPLIQADAHQARDR